MKVCNLCGKKGETMLTGDGGAYVCFHCSKKKFEEKQAMRRYNWEFMKHLHGASKNVAQKNNYSEEGWIMILMLELGELIKIQQDTYHGDERFKEKLVSIAALIGVAWEDLEKNIKFGYSA